MRLTECLCVYEWRRACVHACVCVYQRESNEFAKFIKKGERQKGSCVWMSELKKKHFRETESRNDPNKGLVIKVD